jgi:hypothetical protein
VAILGLLGLGIFKATNADIADLSEEHSHRMLRVRGKGPWLLADVGDFGSHWAKVHG